MPAFRVIALTGGIGSGKSAVARYLAGRGVHVYDSDSRAKALYAENPGMVSAIEDSLGLSLRGSGGIFSPALLAKAVFSSTASLRKVESVVHPAVLDDFRHWLSGLPEYGPGFPYPVPFVIMESAIVASLPLFKGVYDALVLVDAPEGLRTERVISRSGLTRGEVAARMARQSYDIASADAVINNDLGFDALRSRTELALRVVLANI